MGCGARSPRRRLVVAGELRHCRRTFRRNPFPSDYGSQSSPEDANVESQGASVHVCDVEIELLRPRNRVAAGDLREARDPRSHVVPTAMLLAVSREVTGKERPRPDETHVAAEDTPKLRQLVERR